MVSQLAWLDHDDAQMRQTLAAIEVAIHLGRLWFVGLE